MNQYYYSWQEFDQDMKRIIDKVKQSGRNFDGVWGPPRGGLVPAVTLSHALNLPLLLNSTKNTLVVDDIADTGKTLSSFERNFIVTIFYHKHSKVVPHIWMREKDNEWIVFPWEKA